jgi:hypothetical protein
MRFEEGSKVGPILTPMMSLDVSGMKLEQVEGAPTNDEPDDPVGIVGGQLPQSL